MGPLTGVKVLDLTHVMAGPTCTLMLADMGADVIKVEAPQGDDTRRTIPPSVGDQAAPFLMMNRNKRGIVINLKTPGGVEVLKTLARSADILVENFAPGVMERFGVGYAALSAENPALVYCSISGFGRTGPYKERRGFDLVAQAMSGIMTFTGTDAEAAPTKCGPPLSDITAGILAAMGILAAYTHRLKTGQGQVVDTSLFEAALTQTYWQAAIALATGESPRAMGSAHPLNAPYQAFEAKDGWLVVGGANQRNWLRLVNAIEAPHLAEDPRFRENSGRMQHLRELEEELSRYFKKRPVAEWLEVLERAGLPCGPVNTMREALEDPHTKARAMVVSVPHPTLGSVQTLGLPVKFSKTPGGPRAGAPLLGQHTVDILREAGFSSTQVEQLVRDNAIATV